MTTNNFLLRPMAVPDIAGAMKLSRAVNWNQTEADWRCLIGNSENVCIAAESAGQIVGTTTAINYANQVAWIGMVLVDKAFRGKGISKRLLTEVFQQLDSCRSIKLDATPEGQPVYKKFDFRDEYNIARLTLAAGNGLRIPQSADDPPEPILPGDLREIIALDMLIFGADRTPLLTRLIREAPEKAWLLKKNNRITAFALGRAGDRFHQVGPVLASTTTDAIRLISRAMQHLTGQAVVADVLCDQVDMLNWLLSIGFVRQRHFIRMYKTENPCPGIAEKQFLIAGPEFG